MFEKIVIYIYYISTLSILLSMVDGCQNCNQILATSLQKSSHLSDLSIQDSLSFNLADRIFSSLDNGLFHGIELESIKQEIDSTMQLYSEESQTNVLDDQIDSIQDIYSQMEYSDNLMTFDSSINILGKR